MKLYLFIGLLCFTILNPAIAKTSGKRVPSNELQPQSSTLTPSTTPPSPTSPSTTSPSLISLYGVPPASGNSTAFAAGPLDPKPLLHFSTNFLDLAQGKTSILIDFFNFKKKFFLNFRSYNSAEKEKFDRNGAAREMTVWRSSFGVGASWYAYDINSTRNWVISPALIFAKIDDAEETTSQAGLGLKAAALFRVGDRTSFEVGILSDTVHASNRNALLLGFGYFL
jgi:hypothetical protein